ncbi:helix-turn-helix domain-containing protein [Brevibacillus brevis]|uniref:helix-turn-helix domain-containing protein n=1 Tax=Brevibacillus brevis TaxID=1393 RepID=UPI0007D8ABE2|nr:helix-turn-helix transcriptional regulator [Brevibacillus brevis]
MATHEFGKYLKALRKSKNITVKSLAELSGVSQSYLTNVENNKRGIPSPDILKKLEGPLGVPYKELMVKAGHWNEADSPAPLEDIKNRMTSQLDEAIRFFVLLLNSGQVGERPFAGKIQGELWNVIDDACVKHGVKSGRKIDMTSGNKSEQIAGAIQEIENTSFKTDLLIELQRIAHEYHLWEDPRIDAGIKPLKQITLEEILQQPSITYHGHQLTDQDKQLITVYLDTLFRDRISSGK